MNEKTENALKNLLDAYSNYTDRRAACRIYPPHDWLKGLKKHESERFISLIDEFNTARLQEAEDNVRVVASDFVRFFNEHGL